MNDKQIKQRILEVANYYSKAMSDTMLNEYARHLTDMDLETLNLAIDRHIQHSKWMPLVADIREAAMLNFVDKAGVPSPAEAWSEVSRHLHDDVTKNVGTLTQINRISDHEWSHPIVRKAAEMLGWQDLWWSKDDNVVSNRARYMDTYKDLLNGLKQQVQHTPDLRNAIKPDVQPKLAEPKQDKPQITDREKYAKRGEGIGTMPDHIREKLDKLLLDKEVK